jgi:hypothetical protein
MRNAECPADLFKVCASAEQYSRYHIIYIMHFTCTKIPPTYLSSILLRTGSSHY